jgi:hypothetical protein
MRQISRRWARGLWWLFALAGCGLVAVTGLLIYRSQQPAGAAATALTPDAEIVRLMRDMQGRTNFPLRIPADTAGFVANGADQAGTANAPTIYLYLRAPQPARGGDRPAEIVLAQIATGPGEIAPLEPRTSPPTTVQVQGVTATLEVGTTVQGVPHARLVWDKDGRNYILSGFRVPADRLIQIANSFTALP